VAHLLCGVVRGGGRTSQVRLARGGAWGAAVRAVCMTLALPCPSGDAVGRSSRSDHTPPSASPIITSFSFMTHHNPFGKARFPRRQRSEAQLPHTAWPHTLSVSTHLQLGQLVHIQLVLW
jgi:hypothetical protein